ncbi:MAG: DNA-directed RNA polymerase subunit beta' [candidate division WS2 bacterium ADurb.Bin280]|uniref:DNA-directed RNA polymerase subunit beta' n=1 Tax=candidate division WS2 bacterium ADurb.Bin280 TaxID=1852829 RepID=A0A1V5SGE5_9BACT|nr:MAG: DNA-directed RNA polymerase subunit beta' [candidate division WS2 bacterium ADurb.Bin280]
MENKMIKQKERSAEKEMMGKEFDAIKISVASPEEILKWSFGEITKPETINYRTQKPERDGLFDERVFGPVKDWECYCGKYKKIRYKGVICDRCGVEVTRSSVRRERMGHIDLVVPVIHVWYLRGGGGVIGSILDMSVSDIESVSYFASYVVISVNEELKQEALSQLQEEYEHAKKSGEVKNNPMALAKLEAVFKQAKQEITSLSERKVLSENEFNNISLKYGQIVDVGIGAEAILRLLEGVDVDKEIENLSQNSTSQVVSNRKKILKRLKTFKDLKLANIKPEYLILKRIPVIPPDLRPMVQLDGGRFAASDLNDLYRRVLNRNNRLKKLITAGAPEVICRNEKRMLQEAVDALIDNSARRGKAAVSSTQRKLRSLSDILRGKQGRFRQNLLGKRVDYSGRSVIVVGPNLKLHQCGIPKVMALELFKTFVIAKLIEQGHVYNVKNATRMIERRESVVWDILEEITSKHYVMLNRAPTLHRLGIQAFQPVLIEGKAIQIHPLVCQAFNADFDGDQMAVHVPLSKNAYAEARDIMLSSKNLLKPASGEPIVTPRFEMVLGSYYITKLEEQGEGVKSFTSKNEAIMAWQTKSISIKQKIRVKLDDDVKESDGEVIDKGDGKIIETCVGRILFNNILPEEIQFINLNIDGKVMKRIVAEIFKKFGNEVTAETLDKIKTLGFEYSTISGLSIGMDDICVPDEKPAIVESTEKKVEEIDVQLKRGLITPEEKSAQIIDYWNQTRNEIEKKMIEGFKDNNPVYEYVKSGTRGSVAQLTQMSGMKGLVVNPAGQIIEIPIISNYREGLSVFEYFISSHGSRKGRSDSALRTSDSGYLTRRLVDVAQDVIITIEDCKTANGIEVIREESAEFGEKFSERLEGRVALNDVKDGAKLLVKSGDEITKEIALSIEKSQIPSIFVRSTITCEAKNGTCSKCYGRDLGSGRLVDLGVAVGIIAAQAIGEPGTQLTMKTFHLGGVTGEDITSGLPRVEELFEARKPRYEAPISEIDGIVRIKEKDDRVFIDIESDEPQKEELEIPSDYEVVIKDGEEVKEKRAIATCKEKKAIRSSIAGVAEVKKGKVIIVAKDKMAITYEVPGAMTLKVKNGEKVKMGQILSEGHLNLSTSLKLRGKDETVKYIIKETKAIYLSQGQTINDKHLEVIIGQMLSKLRVVEEGETDFVPGQIIDRAELEALEKSNKNIKKTGLICEPIVMGITRVALKTDSFLSAASFQETTGVLISAAIRGDKDDLKGLKENVIIGKLIPAGTGFKKGKFGKK